MRGALYESAVCLCMCVCVFAETPGRAFAPCTNGGFLSGGRPGMEYSTAGLMALPDAGTFSLLVSGAQMSPTAQF